MGTGGSYKIMDYKIINAQSVNVCGHTPPVPFVLSV